jgi:hypothetical protein
MTISESAARLLTGNKKRPQIMIQKALFGILLLISPLNPSKRYIAKPFITVQPKYSTKK